MTLKAGNINQSQQKIIPGSAEHYIVNLHAHNVTANKGFMLIDLSDTVNWPHEQTGRIIIKSVNLNINPDSNFDGDLYLGWLKNVDAASGDLSAIHVWHYDRKGIALVDKLDFGGEGCQFDCNGERWFGEVYENDTTFQSDVNLVGPDGNVSYPSGDGDLVCQVKDQSLGSLDFTLMIAYDVLKAAD